LGAPCRAHTLGVQVPCTADKLRRQSDAKGFLHRLGELCNGRRDAEKRAHSVRRDTFAPTAGD